MPSTHLVVRYQTRLGKTLSKNTRSSGSCTGIFEASVCYQL